MSFATMLVWAIEIFAAFHVVYTANELYEHKKRSIRGLFYDDKTATTTLDLGSKILINLVYTWIISVPITEILGWNEFDRRIAFIFTVIVAIRPIALAAVTIFLSVLMLAINVICNVSKEDKDLPDKYKDYPIVKNLCMDTTQAIAAIFVAVKLFNAL